MTRTLLPSLMIAVALGPGGCSTPVVTPPPASAPVTVASDVASGDEDGVGVAPSAPAAPAAAAAALTFVTAWARPELDRDTWFARVRGLVVPQYARLLTDTDPSSVPAHTVVGPARVLSSTTAVLVADVPTDAGTIQVTVLHAGDRWLVATAQPGPS